MKGKLGTLTVHSNQGVIVTDFTVSRKSVVVYEQIETERLRSGSETFRILTRHRIQCTYMSGRGARAPKLMSYMVGKTSIMRCLYETLFSFLRMRIYLQ